MIRNQHTGFAGSRGTTALALLRSLLLLAP
jgi:hypothetical protein